MTKVSKKRFNTFLNAHADITHGMVAQADKQV
jgi:hypothetical protein